VKQNLPTIRSSVAEFNENSVIRNFLITASDGKSHEIAKSFAESEFEKYRIVQDRLFKSDFDKLLEEIGKHS